VSRGETLYSIARRYGVSVWAIQNANGISNPNRIYAGQWLKIPGKSSGGGGGGGSSSSGGVHVVRRGQTLAGIARAYGTSVSAIAQANGIRNVNHIYTGQRLKIPGRTSGGGGGSAASAPTGNKWIDVDLSSQRVYARQGNSVVKTFVASTGLSRYPTPPGTFRIYAKYRAIRMRGPGYNLPNVPHTMFFYKGYAIHGTYWHNNFGRRMSHGCVNLKQGDAAWLYNWAPNGTLVKIRW
jgi:lipoprotein-anchoring transpeptidase ErfK/SrfK